MKDENSILRKIERCEALSKSPNGNEAAVAYKQMQALINKYSTPYKASQINFKTGDKVVYIEVRELDLLNGAVIIRKNDDITLGD